MNLKKIYLTLFATLSTVTFGWSGTFYTQCRIEAKCRVNKDITTPSKYIGSDTIKNGTEILHPKVKESSQFFQAYPDSDADASKTSPKAGSASHCFAAAMEWSEELAQKDEIKNNKNCDLFVSWRHTDAARGEATLKNPIVKEGKVSATTRKVFEAAYWNARPGIVVLLPVEGDQRYKEVHTEQGGHSIQHWILETVNSNVLTVR